MEDFDFQFVANGTSRFIDTN